MVSPNFQYFFRCLVALLNQSDFLFENRKKYCPWRSGRLAPPRPNDLHINIQNNIDAFHQQINHCEGCWSRHYTKLILCLINLFNISDDLSGNLSQCRRVWHWRRIYKWHVIPSKQLDWGRRPEKSPPPPPEIKSPQAQNSNHKLALMLWFGGLFAPWCSKCRLRNVWVSQPHIHHSQNCY